MKTACGHINLDSEPIVYNTSRDNNIMILPLHVHVCSSANTQFILFNCLNTTKNQIYCFKYIFNIIIDLAYFAHVIHLNIRGLTVGIYE